MHDCPPLKSWRVFAQCCKGRDEFGATPNDEGATYRHCFRIPVAIVAVEQLEHVLLEPFAVFFDRVSCLSESKVSEPRDPERGLV